MRRSWVWLAVGLLTAGCGDGTKDGTAGGTASAGDFCRSFGQASLERAISCYGGRDFFARLYSQLSDCDSVPAAVAAGQLVYDASKAAECLSQIESKGCNDVSLSTLDACERALAGTSQAGGTCRTGASWSGCAPGTMCSASGESCSATCFEYSLPNVAEGQPCVAGACRYDLYCEGRTATAAGTCRARKTSGTCTTAAECATGYVCSGRFSGAGTCIKEKLEGEACTPGAGECYVLWHCSSDGKCAPPATRDQPCNMDPSKELVMCDVGLFCEASTATAAGTCKPAKPAGASCTGASGECAGRNSYCDSTTRLCVVCS